MFYYEGDYNNLFFGDVLKGYPFTTPTIDSPFLNNKYQNYQIDVIVSNLYVIIDPSCAIEKGTISLTPLIEVNSAWWDYPFFSKDMVRVNKVWPAWRGAHPQQWNNYSEKEEVNLYNETPRYPYSNFFVYGEHLLLPEYVVKRDFVYDEDIDEKTNLPIYKRRKEHIEFNTRYYMIDFKKIFHIKCPRIKSPRDPIDQLIKTSKVLQLSISARNDLRNKLATFFGNIPMEDRVEP